MAKFSKSYSLSQPAIDKLQKIADNMGISNSEAIEYLIFKEDDGNRIRAIVMEMLQGLNTQDIQTKFTNRVPEKNTGVKDEVSLNIKNSIEDAFKNMK